MSEQPPRDEPLPAGGDGTGTGPGAGEGPPTSRGDAWKRVWRMGAPRFTKANLLVTVLGVALGFALATQIASTQEAGLESLSQSELLQVFDDVSQRSARLDTQLDELQRNRDELRSGVDTAAAALEQAQNEVDKLSILAGTAPATGPGISITFADPESKMGSTFLLDVVEELRDAGAEVIQVGPVRLVAQSYFDDEGDTVYADGTALPRPLTILAIGDPDTMSSAMAIPGGVVDSARQLGGSATVTNRDTVDITALHTPVTPRFATPVPATSSPAQ